MQGNEARDGAIEELQQLGLKEYEAKCFVGLSRLSKGTAKELSEITDVPRTRVYDAIRVLEAQGLVEVQHSSPQQFRAVSIPEATETLRNQYENRIDRLTRMLEQTERIERDDEPIQEVWTLSGSEAVANRTYGLLDEAESEVVLVVGDESLLTPDLVEHLNDCAEDVDLLVGAVSEDLETRVQDAVQDVTSFISGIDWLRAEDETEDDLVIGRLLLVDRSTMLVSTLDRGTGDEQAVFGRGFRNAFIVIARRLLSQGLLPGADPTGG